MCTRQDVAPLVGAWIETDQKEVSYLHAVSLPSWERGLKLLIYLVFQADHASLPSWERGLKPVIRVLQFGLRDSRPPSRTGGLKPSGWGKWGSSLTIILKEEVRKKSCKRNSRITRHTVSVHLL